MTDDYQTARSIKQASADAPTKRYFAAFDIFGLPRAWGASTDAKAASEECQRQLTRYIEKKALGEHHEVTDFDIRELEVPQ